jgi:hypothetical protein
MLTENEPVASEPDSQPVESGPQEEARALLHEEPKPERKRRGRQTEEEPQTPSALSDRAFDQAARRLQVCGRCSMFLAECRVKLDADDLDSARQSLTRQKEWLELPWGPVVRSLVFKMYATPDDHEYYYFDGHCPECGRRFVYHEQPIEERQPSFRLHL